MTSFIKKIIEKYKAIPLGVKVSVALVVCSLFQKGIQMITTPIFTRLLTTEEYGQISVYSSWLSIISIFATLHLVGGGFNNGMLKYPNDRDGFIASMQGLSTTLTLLCFLVYFIATNFWNNIFGLSTLVMVVMFSEILFQPALGFWSARQRYEYKYISLVVVTLLFSILNPIIGVIAVTNSEARGTARIISSSSVQAFAGLVFYIYNFYKNRQYFNKEYWKFALLFNIPLVPHYLSQIVLSQSDRIMIENMCGRSYVGLYSVAYAIGMVMLIILSAINASLIPWTFESMKVKNYKAIGRMGTNLTILMAIVSLIPTMLAPEVIRLLATPEYLNGMWVVAPVAIGVYFWFIYGLFGNIEFYFEKSKYVMYGSVIAAVSNIILNYIFIKLFGYIAAGYTTMACYLLLAFTHYIFMKKICFKENVDYHIYSLKELFYVSALLIVLTACFMSLYDFFIIRYFLIIIMLSIIFIKRKYIISILKGLKKHE